jgi:hypothetical protein
MIKSKRMRWAGHVARLGELEECIQDIDGKAEGKRTLGRPSHKVVGQYKMGLREIGWDGMVWTGLIWLRIGTSGGPL